MTFFEGYAIAQSLITAIVGLLLFTLRSGLKTGKLLAVPEEIERRLNEMDERVKAISGRMDSANTRMSTYASGQQRLMEDARKEFCSIDMVEQYVYESRTDRKQIRDEVNEMRRENYDRRQKPR